MAGIFKAYDIRGIYGKELTTGFAYDLGKAIITYTKAKTIVIGYDSRLSNKALFDALSRSICETGRDVINIGIVTRPMLNWVAYTYKYDLGIIITASHNPKEYNGFKFLHKGLQMSYDHGLAKVEQIMQKIPEKKLPSPAQRKGKVIEKDYVADYVRFLSSNLSKDFRIKNTKSQFRIAADASNGAAGRIIEEFCRVNDIKCSIINKVPDGNFPAHDPNPLHDEALKGLSREVKKSDADFGFIVDPDADRIRFVDEQGSIIDNIYSAALVSRYLIAREQQNQKKKNTAIVHDLISRKILSEMIKQDGAREIVSKVGFANISHAMRKADAIFGIETSGHFCFRHMNYLDSGMMMLVEFINMRCSKQNSAKSVSELVKPLDKYIDGGELNYELHQGTNKDTIINNVLKHYTKNKSRLAVKKISTLDGVSVYFGDAWFNIRPSNTEPLLRLRLEAKDKDSVERLKSEIEGFIKA